MTEYDPAKDAHDSYFAAIEAKRARGDTSWPSPIRYTLPFPPSTNNLFFGVGKRRVKSEGYVRWIRAAQGAILEQGRKRLHGPVSFSVALVPPDKRKRDLDNTLKPLLDLLVSMAVIDDDSLVQRISIQWVGSGDPCTVLIMAAEQEMAA